MSINTNQRTCLNRAACVFTPVSAELKKTVKPQPRTTMRLNGMAGMSSWPTWQTMMTPDENDPQNCRTKRLNISYPDAQMAWCDIFLYIYGEILNAMKVERHLLTVTRGNKAPIQTMWQWNRSSFSWAVKRQWHESARTVMLEPCQHPRHPDCKYSAQSL